MTFKVLFVLTIKYIPDNSTLPTVAPIIQFRDFSHVSKVFFCNVFTNYYFCRERFRSI